MVRAITVHRQWRTVLLPVTRLLTAYNSTDPTIRAAGRISAMTGFVIPVLEATGKGPHIAARMPPELIADVEAWAAANDTSRSDAFRRLVELGLKAKGK